MRKTFLLIGALFTLAAVQANPGKKKKNPPENAVSAEAIQKIKQE
jgi:hypothetical protein